MSAKEEQQEEAQYIQLVGHFAQGHEVTQGNTMNQMATIIAQQNAMQQMQQQKIALQQKHTAVQQ